MIFKKVTDKKSLKQFYKISKMVYQNLPCHRSTEDDVLKLLIEKPTSFKQHADIKSFLIEHNSEIIGRFSLIWDKKLIDYVQVAFFESLPGLIDIGNNIKKHAKREFPNCKKIVFGLNGHLNYGAGYLLSRFDKVPLFGLPYTPSYYHEYFKHFKIKEMFSFKYSLKAYDYFMSKYNDKDKFKDISVRTMSFKNLKDDIKIYTYLNNACFQDHPYWADRTVDEDYELFFPFRFLLKEENLLIAEDNGKPVGFILWYPDFNELVNKDRSLGLKDVLAYKFFKKIRSHRLTEIAVLPEYNCKPVAFALILKLLQYIKRDNFEFGEGGFIFKSNAKSINLAKRCIERAYGNKVKSYRKYALYESKL